MALLGRINKHYYFQNLCRSKEIEFTLPPGAFSFTPPRSRRSHQKLDIPTKSQPPSSLSPGDALGGNNVRQRRFSSALLFPGRTDGSSSPLMSPSILLHCSAPSSPVPNYSPSPAHSPCLSPLPSVNMALRTLIIVTKKRLFISYVGSCLVFSGILVLFRLDRVLRHRPKKFHQLLRRAETLQCQVKLYIP